MNDSLIITEPIDWKSWLKSIDPSKVLIITDHNTEKYCLDPFKDRYEIDDNALHLSVKPGETSKSIKQVESLWSAWIEMGLDRDALIVSLGGGMLSDLVGFAASTYKRGVRCVYVPTTNLAMCDASIGGKTGINFAESKNQIGSFQLPTAVLIDILFLKSLPDRQLRSGYAETIKHALISSNSFWQRLRNQTALDISKELILESMKVKQTIVSQDFQDQGIRQALNFGHTIGHAVESACHSQNHIIYHGEAVAFGIIAESWLSHTKLGLSADSLSEITNYVIAQVSIAELKSLDVDLSLKKMSQDKKNLGSDIQCTLLEDIGKVRIKNKVSIDELEAALHFTKSLLIE